AHRLVELEAGEGLDLGPLHGVDSHLDSAVEVGLRGPLEPGRLAVAERGAPRGRLVVAVPDSARGRLDARGRVGGRRGVTLLLVVAQAAAGDDEEEGDGSRCASTQAHAAIVPSAGSGTEQTLGEVAGDAVEADPLLGHRVALAHRDRVVLEGVE